MDKKKMGAMDPKLPEALQQFSPCPHTSAVLERSRDWPEKNVAVSVILPVYRTKPYIRQCLQTLLNQETETDYEIVVVEDGCPEQTLLEVRELLSDSRIQMIRQENKGFSGARNTGISRARGEYLIFVDSDDYVSPWMLETLLNPLRTGKAALSAAGYTELKESSGRTRDKLLLEGAAQGPYGITGFPWAKAFRRELFDRVKFPEGYWFEDTIMKHLIAPLAGQIYCCGRPVYIYRNRRGSISRRAGRNPKCIDSTWITWQMLKDRKKLGLVNDGAYLEYFLKQLILNFKRELKVPEEIKKQIFQWMVQIVRSEFPETVFHKDYWKSCGNRSAEKLYRALAEENYRGYCWLCYFGR